MLKRPFTKRSLLLLLLLTSVYAVSKTGCSADRNELSPQQRTQELLRVVAVHELILQEAILDIITKAEIDEHGNPVLYFVSAGSFGNTKLKQVLFRGCLQIRYGVDMAGTVLEVTSDGNGTILLKLPDPRIIGNPVVLTETPYQSVILDVIGEGWWAGRIARAEVQNQIHLEYVKSAAKLCDGLGLEQKTKERAEQVLRAFLKPVLDGKNLVILWGSNNEAEIHEQGELTHGDDDKTETSALDSSSVGSSGMGGYVDDDVVRQLGDSRGFNDYDNGFVCDALFHFPAEPICCISDGSVGTGESSGVCVGR